MATSESIESASVNNCTDAAQIQRPASVPLETRLITVSFGNKEWCTKAETPPIPQIRIKGRWLEKAGFQIGLPVKVIVHQELLIVELDTREVPRHLGVKQYVYERYRVPKVGGVTGEGAPC